MEKLKTERKNNLATFFVTLIYIRNFNCNKLNTKIYFFSFFEILRCIRNIVSPFYK